MSAPILDHAVPRAISAEEYMRAKLDYEMTPTALNLELDRTLGRVLIIDVRDKPSFDKEHIPGAVSIPEYEIRQRGPALDKKKTLVAYSWDMNCRLAPEAVMKLAGMGFKAQLLSGGLEDWKRRDLPVERRVSPRRGATA